MYTSSTYTFTTKYATGARYIHIWRNKGLPSVGIDFGTHSYFCLVI